MKKEFYPDENSFDWIFESKKPERNVKATIVFANMASEELIGKPAFFIEQTDSEQEVIGINPEITDDEFARLEQFAGVFRKISEGRHE